jgi:hypothetical protein
MLEKLRKPASVPSGKGNNMKNLSKEMIPAKAVSKKMRALLDKEKSEARKRIIERGIVHFRGDQEFMEALLKAAERSKVAPGTLCRRIVWDYLQSPGTRSVVAEGTVKYSTERDEVLEKLSEIQELVEQALKGRKAKKDGTPKSHKK